MKRKKEQLPLPLRLVKDFEQSFPHCWEWSDYMRGGRGKNLPEWTDLCYLPLAAAQAVMLEKYDKHDLNYSAVFAALASWRQYKEIYSFSPELTETLYAQGEEDIVVPTEILFRIPYPCIYISTGENDGFFAFFEQDMHTMQIELRFCIVCEKNNGKIDMLNTWLHLGEGYTISDGIAAGIKLIQKNYNGKNLEWNIKSSDGYLTETCDTVAAQMYDAVSKRIQLVLYICAENAEIEENPQQKQITRKPPKGTKPKDAYREIRSWDVGIKFSRAIKNARAEQTETIERPPSEKTGTRNSPRPHTRRGHWQHYWVGSRSDNSRRLILKWIAPTFVGGNSDKTIATINIIK